jgi:hypothetical protein
MDRSIAGDDISLVEPARRSDGRSPIAHPVASAGAAGAGDV